MSTNLALRAGVDDPRTLLATWPLARLAGHAVGLVLSILWAWQIGHDSNWDLFNYHIYNGTAVFNGSFSDDVAAGGIQTFLNPLIDVPLGAAIESLGLRAGVVVATATLQYFCYLSLWRLIRTLLDGPQRLLASSAAMLLSVVGAGAVSIAFTTFGDWVVAAVLCEGLGRIIRSTRLADHPKQALLQLVIGGLVIGSAVGLKLSAAPFAIGLLLTLPLLFGLWDTAKAGAAMAVGFLGVAGPWMVVLQLRYGSPVFPFYNAVFRSDSAPATSFDDARFGATGPSAILRAPLQLARGSSSFGELPFRDWRLLGAVTVVVVSVALSGRLASVLQRSLTAYLGLVLAISYLIWIVQFGYYRYFVFGEILASLLIVSVIFELFADRRRGAACCAGIALIGLMFQHAPDWGHDTALYAGELAVITADIPDDYTVALLAGPPLSYLDESLAGSPQIVNVFPFLTGEFLLTGRIGDELNEALESASKSNSLYAITEPGADQSMPLVDGASLTDCREFVSATRPLWFCRVDTDSP